MFTTGKALTTLRVVSASFVVFIFVSGKLRAQERHVCTEIERILVIAADRVRQIFPFSDAPDKLKPIVKDKGESWEVSYQLPDGFIGGTPVVEIRKDTCEVINAYHEQ